jgi:hypothetical protein
VALLWFRNRLTPGIDATAAELGAVMHSLSLTGPVNISRLKMQLASHPATVKGLSPGSFKLKLSQVPALDASYTPLAGAKTPTVAHLLLPEAQTSGSRRYLERLSFQLNGCYEAGFYDGCAVLLRRMIESLLIDSFEKANHSDAIKHQGEYVGLAEVIGIASSGKFIKLSRGSSKALSSVKGVGDTAAHHRTYITVKSDIDEISHDFRKLVSELMVLAGMPGIK